MSVSGFYDIYRPLLGAFWPDGVTLEGVGPNGVGPDGDVVVRAKGPSAGQSTMFMLFDLMLAVPVNPRSACLPPPVHRPSPRHPHPTLLRYDPPKTPTTFDFTFCRHAPPKHPIPSRPPNLPFVDIPTPLTPQPVFPPPGMSIVNTHQLTPTS